MVITRDAENKIRSVQMTTGDCLALFSYVIFYLSLPLIIGAIAWPPSGGSAVYVASVFGVFCISVWRALSAFCDAFARVEVDGTSMTRKLWSSGRSEKVSFCDITKIRRLRMGESWLIIERAKGSNWRIQGWSPATESDELFDIIEELWLNSTGKVACH